MSIETFRLTQSRSNLRRSGEVWIADEGVDAPPCDVKAESQQDDGDWPAVTRAPGVIKANVSNAVEAVVEGDDEETDVDRDEPMVLKEAALNDLKGEAFGRAHFGGEVLDPEVHDEQHEQRGARDALQVPVESSS